MIVLISMLIIVIFGLADMLILLSSDWPHLYATVDMPIQKWEEIVIYMPFGNAFSFQNPFPIAPTYDNDLMGYSVYPCVTFFIMGILFKIFAFGNLDVYILLSHTILPLIDFWLIFLIFNKYISKTWAILLSFFAITYYPSFHYYEILKWIFNSGSNVFPFINSLPEIARTPFPSISLLLFLVPFYLTIRSNAISKPRILFLSALWALQINVYFFNFIAGSLFFIFWIVYACYINDRSFSVLKISKLLLIYLGISMVFVLPYYATIISPLGTQLQSKLFNIPQAIILTSDWGIIFGYVAPIFLILITFSLFRGDTYDLFYRCTPIFIAIMVDLIIGTLYIISGKTINPELYFHRISNIFFRYFYFLPFLYFIGGSEKPIYRSRNSLQLFLHNRLPSILKLWFHKYRLLYCGLGISLISLFIIINAFHISKKHELNIVQKMKISQEQMDIVKNINPQRGSIVVSKNIASNLLLPSITNYNTLLVSSYGNYVDQELILDRLILYAKIFKWDENRFLEFMEPNQKLTKIASYKYLDKRITDEDLKYGLGYWLLQHKKILKNADELKVYRNWIIARYRNSNVNELLKKNKISIVLVDDKNDIDLNNFVYSKSVNKNAVYFSKNFY